MNHYFWREIPRDILNYILIFDGKIKYRNGKYIDQIQMNEYNCLLQIPRPVFYANICQLYGDYYFVVNFSTGKKKLHFSFSRNNIYVITYVNGYNICESLHDHKYDMYVL